MALSNIKYKKLISKFPTNIDENYNPWKSGYFCIPLRVSNGFLVNTENGQFNIGNIDIDYNTWKELIAVGNGDIQVVWDGAIEGKITSEDIVVNVSGEDEIKTYNPYTDCTIKVGKYFFGYASNYDSGFSIGGDSSYNGFNTITQQESFSLLVNDSNGVNFDLFRFYTFPEITKKVFYISSITTNTDPNDTSVIISYEITFEHVGNKLQKSGKAIEEYIHYSSAGGFAPFPIVDRKNKKISIDPNMLNATGIYTVNEEMYNACIQCSSFYYGWRIVEDDNEGFNGTIQIPKLNDDGETYSFKLYNPTRIFPIDFSQGSTNILSKKSFPESDYTYIDLINFTEDKWTDWKKTKENQITRDFDGKYDGEMNFTNKKELVGLDELNNDEIENYTQSHIASPYIENINNTIGNINWATTNFFNSWSFDDIVVLPFIFTLHSPNLLKNWFLVGKLFNFATGGYPLGYNKNYTNLIDVSYKTDGNPIYTNVNKNINGLINTSYLTSILKDWDFDGPQIGNKLGTDCFLQNFFASNSADHFNSNNRTMSIKYNLTDVVSFQTDDNINSEYFGHDETGTIYCNTAWFGQQYAPKDFNIIRKQEDGYRHFYNINNDLTPKKINSTFRPVDNRFGNLLETKKPARYIICGYCNKNFASQSIKLSMFDVDGNEKWQGAFDTECNFRDNSREWTNMFLMNFFNVLDFGNGKIDFPVVPNFTYSFDDNWVCNIGQNLIENDMENKPDNNYTFNSTENSANPTDRHNGSCHGAIEWHDTSTSRYQYTCCEPCDNIDPNQKYFIEFPDDEKVGAITTEILFNSMKNNGDTTVNFTINAYQKYQDPSTGIIFDNNMKSIKVKSYMENTSTYDEDKITLVCKPNNPFVGNVNFFFHWYWYSLSGHHKITNLDFTFGAIKTNDYYRGDNTWENYNRKYTVVNDNENELKLTLTYVNKGHTPIVGETSSMYSVNIEPIPKADFTTQQSGSEASWHTKNCCKLGILWNTGYQGGESSQDINHCGQASVNDTSSTNVYSTSVVLDNITFIKKK